jgi:hypothetical protein
MSATANWAQSGGAGYRLPDNRGWEFIMAFGFKLKTVKTKESFENYQQLFDRIKDVDFTAGKPELVKNGFADVIVFPPLDRQNQIWVMLQGKNKIIIQKNQVVGVADQAINAAFDAVTDGLFSVGSIMGKNSKKIEKLVEATASEIEALNL